MYEHFIKKRVPLHWGGLSDGFCHFEKRFGISLKLLKFFDSIDYPIVFSTKGTIMTEPEYLEIFKRKPQNYEFAFSIITSDPEMAKKIEVGVPSPQQRLEAMRIMSNIGCRTILRLRPYIIGCSSLTSVDLLEKAKDAGASGVSTEFFCLDTRVGEFTQNRYKKISEAIGFDIVNYYKKLSIDQGYLRLNKKVKEPYILELFKNCRRLGLNFACSDPDFKELSDSNCCCCVMKQPFACGQFTTAIRHARQHGTVTWDDIAKDLEWAKKVFLPDTGVSFINEHVSISKDLIAETRENLTVFDYIRGIWNNPKSSQKSPFKYFHGKIKPISLDSQNNVVYKYIRDSSDTEFEKIEKEFQKVIE